MFTDPVQCLVVLHFGHGTTLTLWQFRPGESLPDDPQPCPFPVVATTDAVAQRIDLAGRGVRTSGLSESQAFVFSRSGIPTATRSEQVNGGGWSRDRVGENTEHVTGTAWRSVGLRRREEAARLKLTR